MKKLERELRWEPALQVASAGSEAPAPAGLIESTNLDFLRAVAVLSVFAGHLYTITTGSESELAWHIAQMGVLLFFVHTSLVLMQSLDRAREEGWDLFRAFYIRRFFRIYPLSVVCVLIAYIFDANPSMEAHASWTLKELFTNLLLIQNLTYSDSMVGGLWSLPLEVQMYLALPVIFVLFRKRDVAWLMALWAVAIPIALLQPHITQRLGVLGYAPCFLAGTIAWRLKHGIRLQIPGWLWPLALAAISTIWLTASRENNMSRRWIFCLCVGLAIPFFRDLTVRWMAQPAHQVAKYSYGIYLSHIAVMWICFAHMLWAPPVLRWLSFCVLAVLTPIVMYHGVENPMIRLGRRLTARQKLAAVPAAAW